MPDQIGVLHPGAMGISVAAAAANGGHEVLWASAGRSSDSRKRAEQANLGDAGSVAELCGRSSVVISVCPPEAAETVANEVLGHGFAGLYVDANAISPQRAKRIGQAMHKAGADFVDGGIIGGPAWKPGMTWLCLSGPSAAKLAQIFSAGPLEAEILDARIGQASALKMCFAAYTKGTTALLASIAAAAEALGVRDELFTAIGGVSGLISRSKPSNRQPGRAQGLALGRRDGGDLCNTERGGRSGGNADCRSRSFPAHGSVQER